MENLYAKFEPQSYHNCSYKKKRVYGRYVYRSCTLLKENGSTLKGYLDRAVAGEFIKCGSRFRTSEPRPKLIGSCKKECMIKKTTPASASAKAER